MSPKNTNDWLQWKKLVLSELKRLAKDTAHTHKQLVQLNETLIRNTASLEEHVKRTNLLEAKVNHIDTHVKKVEALSWLFSRDNLLLKLLMAAGVAAVAYLTKVYL